VKGTKIVDAEAARRYLESKFGDSLPAVQAAMKQLAMSFPPRELAKEAYTLYEQFRPEILAGTKGVHRVTSFL